MRIVLRRAAIVLCLPILLPSCKAQEKARIRAIEAALKPHSQLEITTGSSLNFSPKTLPYLRKLESAGLITVQEVPQDYWGGFATQTFMEGAKPYSIHPTQRLTQLAVNPRTAPPGTELSLATITKDREYSWNFYSRCEVLLGLHLFGNTSGGTDIHGNPPSTLTLMSAFPTYTALAQKGLLVLEDVSSTGIPRGAFQRDALIERAAKVSLTVAGEKLAMLDKKANTATFVFGTHKLETLLLNDPIDTNDGTYRLVEGTHVFDLRPEYSDLASRLGWSTYRERRFRVIYTYKGWEGRDSTGRKTTSPAIWRVAEASNGRYSAEDDGPRTGPYTSSNVPPTVAALRRKGSGGDDRYTWRIDSGELKVAEVLRDDEYKGPLATLGESFRLVLASIHITPATGKAAIPPELTGLLPGRLRSVLKYDAFAKSWAVVALDVGPGDTDSWYTSNVQ
jgi:hypothetical protein